MIKGRKKKRSSTTLWNNEVKAAVGELKEEKQFKNYRHMKKKRKDKEDYKQAKKRIKRIIATNKKETMALMHTDLYL